MLPNKLLVIHQDGVPVQFAYDDEDAREYLADVFEDAADRYEVYVVHNDGTEPELHTMAFADAWSDIIEFGDGDEPDEFLKPFPGFVRGHVSEALIETYRAAQEQRDSDAFELSKLRTL